MPPPSDQRAPSPRLALRAEEALRRGLEFGATTWGRIHAAIGGETNLAPDALRGRRCHCPPDLVTHLVHSEALREACDLVIDEGANVRAKGRPALPATSPALRAAAAVLPPGASIHVKTDRLDAFVAHVLPSIRGPIVLVTGDSDASPVLRHAALLDHPSIAHWFVQNCDRPGRHPRLTRVPIGFDNPIYTKLEKRLGFAVTMALRRTPFDLTCSRNDIGDQRVLQAIGALLPPPRERSSRVLCTFHQNQKIIRPDAGDLPPRAEAVAALRNHPDCHFGARRLRQRDCWALHGDFAFEASPHGNGLDCFRTWEALFLGTIPIVKSSTLDPLYEDEGFPVVIVRDWREITPANLAAWREELQGKRGPETELRLTAEHWINKIKMASRRARESQGSPA